MRRTKFHISAGAVFLLAALYLLLDFQTLAALAIPIAVHELGHFGVLRLQGAKVRGLRIGMDGLCITYTGHSGYGGQFLAALAGPAAGIIFALAAARLGVKLESSFLCVCAGISVLLSLFNLLPALPLDGGRMLAAFLCERRGLVAAEKITGAVGIITGTALLAAGLILIWLGKGSALEIAAVWLMLSLPEGIGFAAKRAGII